MKNKFNLTLFGMMYSISSIVIIGLLIVAAFATGRETIPEIIMAAIIGAIIAIPVGIVMANKVDRSGES